MGGFSASRHIVASATLRSQPEPKRLSRCVSARTHSSICSSMGAVQILEQILEYLVGREYLIRYFFQILQYLLQILQYLLPNTTVFAPFERSARHQIAARSRACVPGRAPSRSTARGGVRWLIVAWKDTSEARGQLHLQLASRDHEKAEAGGKRPRRPSDHCRQLEARGA